jgi:hypothetical protein
MILVDPRHNGPPASGHGGISAGLLAAELGAAAQETGAVVRLQAPVPLGRPLQPRPQPDGTVTAYDGQTAIATARSLPEPLEVGLFPAVGADVVRVAEERWASERATYNPFPTCFGCGTERTDGWHLSPGLIEGQALFATSWQADRDPGDVPPWAPWAVLDCTQVGPVIDAATPPAAMLTGELACRSLRPVLPGRRYVALSRRTDLIGKKVFTEGALFDADGPVAVARAIWFVLPSY